MSQLIWEHRVQFKNKIFCIAAGQEQVKKANNNISKKNLYLNYGLLSLASILNRSGYEALVIHGHFESPEDTLNICIKHNLLDSEQPLLISVPSFYAASWANKFIGLLKIKKPLQKIILGGRWVIGEREDLAQKLFPQVDLIVKSIAEHKIVDIVSQFSKTPNQFLSNNTSSKNYALDYSLLFNRRHYHPSIEISRGCGMGCDFCQEKYEPLQPLKHPKLIINEVENAILDHSTKSMNFYFETSMFSPTESWVNEMYKAYIDCEHDFFWRTEARVDSIRPRYMESLYGAGLRVIDIGLESASHEQLIAMGKTSNPAKYLRQASDTLRSAFESGIKTKVNVLLYPGETKSTIYETESWLDQHKDCITGVSSGPVIVYGWDEEVSMKQYVESLFQLGASLAENPMTGVSLLNLSKEIDYDESIAIANNLSRKFMSSKDYFDLKSFSYFSRDYTYEDFILDLKMENGIYGFGIGDI